MSNNGTPYDKTKPGYCRCCCPPEMTPRKFREAYAIQDSIESNEHDFDPCACEYTWEEPCPQGCGDVRSVEQRILESRRKHGRKTKKGWGGRSSHRYKRYAPDGSLTACGGEPHVFIDQYRWVPQEAFYNDEPKMARLRFMVCTTCDAAYEMREGWRRTRVRPMTPWELADYEKERKKTLRWLYSPRKKKDTPAPYGLREDGTPVTRNEFKQAPPKRVVRKRQDEEAA